MIAQLKYRASAVLMAASLAFAGCDSTETTTSNTTDTTMVTPATDAAAVAPATGTPATTVTLNTNDMYTDLRTGKQMHVKQMAMNTGGSTGSDQSGQTSASWAWENDQPLDYFYVNNATHDTFQGATGELVSGYLLYDASSKKYSLDEARYRKNGDGYKATSADGDVKVKENSNELKVKDDENNTKLKANDNEVKYKDKENGVKYKSNGDETKIKTKDQKIKIKDGKTTVKPR